MRKSAYKLGRDMVWSSVAQRLHGVVRAGAAEPHRFAGPKVAGRSRRSTSSPAAAGVEARPSVADDRFDRHLSARQSSRCRISPKATARTTTPAPWCWRVMLEELGHDSPANQRGAVHLRGVPQSRLRSPTRRFRNFMSFDRRWLEEVGSEDCQGQALWALGHVRRPPRRPGSFQLVGGRTVRAGPAAVRRVHVAARVGVHAHRH